MKFLNVLALTFIVLPLGAFAQTAPTDGDGPGNNGIPESVIDSFNTKKTYFLEKEKSVFSCPKRIEFLKIAKTIVQISHTESNEHGEHHDKKIFSKGTSSTRYQNVNSGGTNIYGGKRDVEIKFNTSSIVRTEHRNVLGSEKLLRTERYDISEFGDMTYLYDENESGVLIDCSYVDKIARDTVKRVYLLENESQQNEFCPLQIQIENNRETLNPKVSEVYYSMGMDNKLHKQVDSERLAFGLNSKTIKSDEIHSNLINGTEIFTGKRYQDTSIDPGNFQIEVYRKILGAKKVLSSKHYIFDDKKMILNHINTEQGVSSRCSYEGRIY